LILEEFNVNLSEKPHRKYIFYTKKNRQFKFSDMRLILAKRFRAKRSKFLRRNCVVVLWNDILPVSMCASLCEKSVECAKRAESN